MEILDKKNISEYEAFVNGHKNGIFHQSYNWTKVKSGWGSEIVVSRGSDGKIKGSMLVLIQRLPVIGSSLLYAPHGPVCDYYDTETIKDLLDGAKLLAKRYRAYLLKVDPIIEENDIKAIENFTSLGFSFKPNKKYGETIQPRSNHMIDNLSGKTEQELLMSFTQKTRYNIRLAAKHGVECRIMREDGIDDFYRLYQITSERDNFGIRSKEYYRNMVKAFGEHCRLYLCYHEGKAISGALCIRFAGRTHYVFGASANEGRQLMPNHLMQWEMIKWALEGGCHTYDFMGTPKPEDENSPMYGLYRFKSGFGGRNVTYAGEFDYVFNPLVNAIFNCCKAVSAKLNRHKN